jgi:hypothetical protein
MEGVDMNFDDIYELLIMYDDLANKEKKEYIPCDFGRCLFCLQDSSSTKFDKSSHAISESIGNKRLFSLRECRTCNTMFGETFENNFGKYVFPFKIISQIYGKKTKLHYKHGTDEIEIKKNSPVLPAYDSDVSALIKTTSDNPILKRTSTGFILTLTRQSYNPEYAYMALLKMAYGIMPSNQLCNFSLGLSYLKAITDATIDDDTKNKILAATTHECFLEFVPGILPLSISSSIYKRKKSADNKYPNFMFVLTFGNFSIQLAIPTDTEIRSVEQKTIICRVHSNLSKIQVQNFHEEESTYSCEFTAELIPIEDTSPLQDIISGEKND